MLCVVCCVSCVCMCVHVCALVYICVHVCVLCVSVTRILDKGNIVVFSRKLGGSYIMNNWPEDPIDGGEGNIRDGCGVPRARRGRRGFYEAGQVSNCACTATITKRL